MRWKLVITGAFIGTIVATVAYAEGENVVTSQNYVDTQLATKQPVLTAQGGDYAVLYPNSTNEDDDGEVGARAIGTSVYNYADAGDLVTVGGVNTALNAKQNSITGTNGNVVVYDGTVGAVGSKPVYNSANAYNTQQNALVQANQVNAAITGGLAALITCAGRIDNSDETSPCILFQINPIDNVF